MERAEILPQANELPNKEAGVKLAFLDEVTQGLKENKNLDFATILSILNRIIILVLLIILLWERTNIFPRARESDRDEWKEGLLLHYSGEVEDAHYPGGEQDNKQRDQQENNHDHFRNENKLIQDRNEAVLANFNSKMNLSSDEITSYEREHIIDMEVHLLKPNFCKYVKPRYFCSGDKYEQWLSRAQLPSDPSLVKFPEIYLNSFKNLKILFVGNSHVRQIYESLICSLQEEFDEIKLTADSKLGWIDIEKSDAFSIFKSSSLNVTMSSVLNNLKFIEDLTFDDFDFIVAGRFNNGRDYSYIKRIPPFSGTMVLTWTFNGKWDPQFIESVKAENLNFEILDLNRGITDFGSCGADRMIPLGACDEKPLLQHQCIPGPPTFAAEEVLKIIKNRSK